MATAEAVPPQQPSDPNVLTKIFDHIQRNADDQKNQGEGTLGYLKSPNRFLVYLARGCDEYKVSIGTARLGRDLYDDLRRSGDVGRGLMVQLGFPCTMTNRIAYGIAAAAWGGETTEPFLRGHCRLQTFPE